MVRKDELCEPTRLFTLRLDPTTFSADGHAANYAFEEFQYVKT